MKQTHKYILNHMSVLSVLYCICLRCLMHQDAELIVLTPTWIRRRYSAKQWSTALKGTKTDLPNCAFFRAVPHIKSPCT